MLLPSSCWCSSPADAGWPGALFFMGCTCSFSSGPVQTDMGAILPNSPLYLPKPWPQKYTPERLSQLEWAPKLIISTRAPLRHLESVPILQALGTLRNLSILTTLLTFVFIQQWQQLNPVPLRSEECIMFTNAASSWRHTKLSRELSHQTSLCWAGSPEAGLQTPEFSKHLSVDGNSSFLSFRDPQFFIHGFSNTLPTWLESRENLSTPTWSTVRSWSYANLPTVFRSLKC